MATNKTQPSGVIHPKPPQSTEGEADVAAKEAIREAGIYAGLYTDTNSALA